MFLQTCATLDPTRPPPTPHHVTPVLRDRKPSAFLCRSEKQSFPGHALGCFHVASLRQSAAVRFLWTVFILSLQELVLFLWGLEVTLWAVPEGPHLASFQGSQKFPLTQSCRTFRGRHTYGEGFINSILLQFFILEFSVFG